jgi:arabinofuranosyltransferase
VKAPKAERASLVILAGLYVVWAGLFIYTNSYIAIDDQRYYALFDDAMISMRYAWNFAHGLGLVWNVGERVEGYSNLLMTLGMALASAFLDKKLAVLAVQAAGVPTMLATAYLTWRLATDTNEDHAHGALVGILACACVLLYYPLSYWTLMGMETGLLTLLIVACAWYALRWLKGNRTHDLVAMAFTAGLAFLTRNDSLLMTGVIFGYVALMGRSRKRGQGRLHSVLYAGVILAAFVAAQILFRLAYYGEVLPNTYTLKLTRFPLNVRLLGGTRFVLEFLGQTWPVFALVGTGLWLRYRHVHGLLIALMLSALGYQVYAGGDPWNTWRLLAPAMPALFILAASGAAALVGRLPNFAQGKLPVAVSLISLTLVPLVVADLPFLADLTVRGPTSAAIANRTHTNAAIAVEELTSREASVGVIWAGTLPFYADRYAVDFLGKSDPYIASLDADVSGSTGWGTMISVPGHNKYDLDYSIVERRPTYSQAYAWGYATVKPYFVENYARVEYHGVAGTKTVFLLKDSPLVCWDACQNQYRIIPWPVQK